MESTVVSRKNAFPDAVDKLLSRGALAADTDGVFFRRKAEETADAGRSGLLGEHQQTTIFMGQHNRVFFCPSPHGLDEKLILVGRHNPNGYHVHTEVTVRNFTKQIVDYAKQLGGIFLQCQQLPDLFRQGQEVLALVQGDGHANHHILQVVFL